MSEGRVVHTGPNIISLLLVLFIGLKLTGYIDWSWWWVLSPLWIVLIITVLVISGLFIYAYRKK